MERFPIFACREADGAKRNTNKNKRQHDEREGKRKSFSEWLMDVSKYITTAVVVASSFFDTMANNVAVVFCGRHLAVFGCLDDRRLFK